MRRHIYWASLPTVAVVLGSAVWAGLDWVLNGPRHRPRRTP